MSGRGHARAAWRDPPAAPSLGDELFSVRLRPGLPASPDAFKLPASWHTDRHPRTHLTAAQLEGLRPLTRSASTWRPACHRKGKADFCQITNLIITFYPWPYTPTARYPTGAGRRSLDRINRTAYEITVSRDLSRVREKFFPW